MAYQAGDTFRGIFTTSNNIGTATNADSLPTAKMSKNGVDDGTVTLTVTNIDTGRYSVSGTIPGTYNPGDTVSVTVIPIMSSNTVKQIIYSEPLDRVALTAATIAAAVWNAAVSGFVTAASVGNQWRKVYASFHGNYTAAYPDPTHVNTTFLDIDGATTLVTSAVVLDSSGRPISRTVT
jgi:hypothetical protein